MTYISPNHLTMKNSRHKWGCIKNCLGWSRREEGSDRKSTVQNSPTLPIQMYSTKAFLKCDTSSVAHLLTTITMIMMVNDGSVIILADNPACRGPCNIDWRRKMQWAQSEYTIQPTERSENWQKSKPNWKRDQREAKLQLNILDLVILISLSLPFKEHVMKISWRWMARWARQLLEQGGRGEGRRAKGGDWRGLKKTSLEKLVICPIKIRAWFRGS